MEIKKRFDFRKVFAALYIAMSFTFITIGLQPAEAASQSLDTPVTSMSIPTIGLQSAVAEVALKDKKLSAPDRIVGSYKKKNSNKTLLIGHSTTAFKNLKNVTVDEIVIYDNKLYKIQSTETLRKEDINMNSLVRGKKDDPETIIIMTCSGSLYEDGDASHRLIVTATRLD